VSVSISKLSNSGVVKYVIIIVLAIAVGILIGYNVARVINNLSASTQINHTIENNMVLVDTDASIL
jgi:ABC-type transporter Mla maintaining outer membrane lipid asymmetry permease subunit MlaE